MSDLDARLWRSIFDEFHDGLVLADDAGSLVNANPAACRLFASTPDRLIGQPVEALTSAGGPALEIRRLPNVSPGLHLWVLRDVTEPSRADAALRRSEARFRAVVENCADGISLTSRDGSVEYLSPQTMRLLGWAPEEMKGRTMRSLVVPEDQPRIAAALAHMVAVGDRGIWLEFRVRHRDGSLLWIESIGTNLLDDPDVAAIVGTYRDITKRKHAEAAALESRVFLEDAQAIAHIGSFTSGLELADPVSWSAECARIFGQPIDRQMTVASFLECVHPDDRERVIAGNRAIRKHLQPFDLEHRVVRPDGSIRSVHSRVVVESAEGRAVRLVGTVQDVTERAAITAALTLSEEKYRRIIENTSEGIWTYDRTGLTTFMNTRMADMLGCTPHAAIGRPIYDFVPPGAQAAARERMEQRKSGRTEVVRTTLRRIDGSTLFVSVQASVLRTAEGHFDGGLAMVSDISGERLADETRARLSAIVESSDDAIISTDLDGLVTSWNSGAERLYQYTRDEIEGRPVSVITPPDHAELERRLFAAASRGERIVPYETSRLRKDGSLVAVSVSQAPMRDVTGVVIGVSKTAHDLTQRHKTEAALRRTEEQFRQAQKMEAVGRLAGGVAHDFNNLLSVILSYAGLAIEDLKADDPIRDDMKEIQAAGHRATALTRQLLAFSRQQVLQLRVVDLNGIIEGMKSMLGRLLGEDIELSFLKDPTIGRVVADAGQIEQVVMNLAVNARDAMLHGGKLTIELANVELDAAYVSGHLGVKAGRYVLLAVSDTGVGMNRDTQARIFEPFFTTKEKGKGTGLGLSTVFGIVEQVRGHVAVYSELGNGSTFKVYLPRTDRPLEAAETPGYVPVLRGTETVLLVEDEEQVRVVASTILRRNGYQVLEASNGDAALSVSGGFAGHIDLLLTDVVMPSMSGRKLAEALGPLRPSMKVLFASGYTDDAIVHHGVLESGMAFIQKPFTPDGLLRRVREVLEG